VADRPVSISAIEDVPLSGRIANVFANLAGRVLTEPSIVLIALNRESVDVLVGVSIGGTEVLPANSAVTVQATVGVMPVLPDDIIVTSAGQAADEIIISATNADAGAPREVRAIAKIIPVEDQALFQAVAAVQGIPAQSMGI
jgi:hypothetical protein